MIKYFAYWLVWISWRMAVSMAALYTLQSVLHQQGYFIHPQTLLLSAVLIIVGVRVWMPSKNGNSVL